MYGNAQHKPPAYMQCMPTDNTSVDVDTQVTYWRRHGRVVHTEIARSVAAWWQGPAERDMPLTRFASTGTLSADLTEAIWRNVRELTLGGTEGLWPLLALLAYVETLPAD